MPDVVCKAEPASVVAFWYHAVSLLVAATALAAGWPESSLLFLSRSPAERPPFAGDLLEVAAKAAQIVSLICAHNAGWCVCRAEPASVVAFWYHAVSLLVAATALAAGWPEFPILPGPAAAAGLFAIGVGSYLGQICWARAFQIGNAARMSAITYSEVCSPLPASAASTSCLQYLCFPKMYSVPCLLR